MTLPYCWNINHSRHEPIEMTLHACWLYSALGSKEGAYCWQSRTWHSNRDHTRSGMQGRCPVEALKHNVELFRSLQMTYCCYATLLKLNARQCRKHMKFCRRVLVLRPPHCTSIVHMSSFVFEELHLWKHTSSSPTSVSLSQWQMPHATPKVPIPSSAICECLHFGRAQSYKLLALESNANLCTCFASVWRQMHLVANLLFLSSRKVAIRPS
jgi:hypothetical protein